MAQNLLDFLTNPEGREQMGKLEQQEPIQSWGVSDEEFSEFNWLDFKKEGGSPEWLKDYAGSMGAPLSKDWMRDQFVGTDDATAMESYFKQKNEFQNPSLMDKAEGLYKRYITDVLSEFM